MARRPAALLTTLGFLVALLGCADGTGGRFAVRFHWQDPPPDGTFHVFARVEDRSATAAPWPVLAAAPAVRACHTDCPDDVTPDAPLAVAFPQVAHGADRVVVVEVRSAPDPLRRVLLYGRSAPFRLAPGEAPVVSVDVALRRPLAEGRARLEVLVAGRPTAIVGRAALDEATLRTRSQGAALVRVAARSTFVGAAERDVATECHSEEGPDGPEDVCDFEAFDITAASFEAPTDATDGAYPIYGQFVDAAGYPADTVTTTVTLDTTAPWLLGSALRRGDGSLRAERSPSELDARPGDEVRATLVVSEPVDDDVTVTLGGRTVAASRGSAPGRTGRAMSFEATLQAVRADACPPDEGEAAGPSDHLCPVVAHVVDAAGNAAALPLGIVRVDATAPPPLDAARQPLVVLERAPWGSEATGGEPRVRLVAEPAEVGAAGARRPLRPFEPHALVTVDLANVVDGAPRCTGAILAVASADEEGALAVPLLAPTGLAAVCVRARDRAGNESPATPVANVVWTASLGNKVAGALTANPHRLLRTPEWRTTLAQDEGVEPEGAGEGLALAGDGRVLTAEAVPTWTHGAAEARSLEPAGGPPGLAYDAARGRLVLVRSVAGRAASTLEWTDGGWRERTTSDAALPSLEGRAGGRRLVFDAARSAVLALDGAPGDDGALPSVTAWDGAAWRARAPLPSPRTGTSATYDARRGRVVVFGGEGGGALFGDTWEWDGRAWGTPRPTGGVHPAARRDGAMAFDEERGVVVLFGGDGTDGPLGDTWEWDGGRWTEVAADGPSPRARAAMAFDPTTATCVLFGGAGDDGAPRADLWRWDGVGWTPDGGALPAPAPRTDAALASDGRRLVLHGGQGTDDAWLSDTWRFEEGAWQRLADDAPVPLPRSGHALTYDGRGARLVLFGGTAENGEVLGDTWEWRDGRWRPLPDGPTPRTLANAAWDGARSDVVLVGGVDGDGAVPTDACWSLDGERWTEEWTAARPPLGAAFADPASAPIAFHDARQDHIVLLGLAMARGAEEGDTGIVTWQWRWDRATGAAHVETSPLAAALPWRTEYRLCRDPRRDRVLWFGGRHVNATPSDGNWEGDTWEWDGLAWRLAAMDGPPGRQRHSLEDDAETGRVLLFGGGTITGSEPLGDLWGFDGIAWQSLGTIPESPVLPRTMHTAGPRAVFFGREEGASRFDEWWEWSARADVRPAFVLAVDWDAADASTAALGAITVRATAGGRGSHRAGGGVEALDGVLLLAWDAWSARWRELAHTEGAPDDPRAIVRTISAATAARFVEGERGTLHLALLPRAGTGRGPRATLTLDALEVEVRYRWAAPEDSTPPRESDGPADATPTD